MRILNTKSLRKFILKHLNFPVIFSLSGAEIRENNGKLRCSRTLSITCVSKQSKVELFNTVAIKHWIKSALSGVFKWVRSWTSDSVKLPAGVCYLLFSISKPFSHWRFCVRDFLQGDNVLTIQPFGLVFFHGYWRENRNSIWFDTCMK